MRKLNIKYKYLILFILYFSLNSLYSQNTKDISAKINLLRKDIFVKIDALVENNEHIYNHKLNYLLLTLTQNPNQKNFTKDSRYGEFTLLPNEKKVVSSLKLNVEPDQKLKIYLFIKDQKQLIALDSVKINETVETLKTTAIQEDEIEIKGLVVENVKTKIGKDFYDIFYQKYNRSGAKYSFVIHINEKPFIGGRGALISIEVDDKKIFEFQARPDEEMLQKAADYALKLIENYSKTRNTFEKVY